MPGGFSIGLELCNGQSIGANLTTSVGTNVTSGASANTKGTYSELITATSGDIVWLIVVLFFTNFDAANKQFAIDIAVGAAGSEVVVLPNLTLSDHGGNGQNQITYCFPVAIPSGSRIAARCQAGTASETILCGAQGFDGAFTHIEGFAGVDAVGFDTANTNGALVDCGTTVNTKGAYTQLTASSAQDYRGFVLGFDQGNVASPSGSQAFLVDVAIGAAGSEQVIVPNYFLRRGNTQALWQGASPLLPISIPAGSRIAARAQSNVNNTTSNPFGLTLYGIF